MDSKTFSRAYLQSLPSEHKKILIDNYLKPFVQEIQEVAKKGKISYMIPIYEASNNPHIIRNYKMFCPDIATNDDLMDALKKIFPQCDVFYYQGWSETSATTKSLKKGIIIDWS
jgi:hypothetical protein